MQQVFGKWVLCNGPAVAQKVSSVGVLDCVTLEGDQYSKKVCVCVCVCGGGGGWFGC